MKKMQLKNNPFYLAVSQPLSDSLLKGVEPKDVVLLPCPFDRMPGF